MKIILRRKDSVTSTVLFVFNIYGEYTNQYSISLSNLIDFMQQFDKNETSTRMGLSRMVKAGILANKKSDGQVFYHLTEYGLENISIWNEGISRFFSRYKKRNQGWDRRWYSVVLPDFNRSYPENQAIMDELGEMGLREINNNTWISPYKLSDQVNKLFLENSIKYFEISGGSLNYNFSLNELLAGVFGIEQVRKRYLEFLSLMKEISQELHDSDAGNGYYLSLLFKLGWNFYDIAISDPALPKELLESWEGDRVVQEFGQMRRNLYEKVTNYFKSRSNFG